VGRLIGVAIVLGSVLGCGGSDEQVVSAIVDVGCGNCIYGMEGAVGCPWAAEIDGEYIYVMGAVPQDHNGHAPDGICNMERQARLEGVVREGNLVVTEVELIPAENIPTPQEHTHEH
jgi:hypothetical protein